MPLASRPPNFDPLRFAKRAVVNPADTERHRLIAEAAYYRAQRRNFQPGHELEDWLEAEADVARQLPRA
jgi:hypothetical protein